MAYKFTISGFSDEIDADIKKQFEHLKELGISYFEPRGINGTNISELTDEQIDDLKKLMNEYGISASSIGSPIGKVSVLSDFDEHLNKLGRVIEIAHRLRTRYIRMFSFYPPEDGRAEDYRDEIMDRLFKMAQLAEGEGVVLLLENDKGLYGDVASRCVDVLKTVNSPSLRAVFDPANFVQSGQRTYPDAYEMMRPYIEYVHIKDALHTGEVRPAGQGEGSVREVLEALKNSGYEGFLSIEPHLAVFVGFAELENGESIQQGGEACSPETFDIAYNALMDILKTL